MREEVRCTCAKQPLLYVAHTDDEGHPFIHIKAYRSNRLLHESIMTEGATYIRCRSCSRFHRVSIRREGQKREFRDLPRKISGPMMD